MSAESQPILSGTELKRLIGQFSRVCQHMGAMFVEKGIPLPELKDGERDLSISAARLALEEYVERLRKDSERIDWLDSLERFNVGLNPHDGIQLYTLNAVGNGIPVILRLWHKDRGGENQSLRDAIDVVRS